MIGKRFIWVAVACVSLFASCGDTAADRGEVIIRDSAGVRVVVNLSPQWTLDDQWRLSATPVVEMRTRSGVPDESLYRVRGAVQLSNGHYVVANAGNHELRWYDADGQFAAYVGGEGGGPGEFRVLAGVAVLGADSVLAWDARNQQVSMFTAQAAYVGSVPLGVRGHVYGVFSDGSMLVGFIVGTDHDGLGRDQVVVRRFNPFTDATDSLGVFPGDERIVQTEGAGDVVRVSALAAPFGRAGVFAVRDQAYLVSNQDRFEIRAYENGTLRSIFRVDRPLVSVTVEDIAAFQRGMLEWLSGSDVAAARRQLAALPYPAVFPAHGAVVIDALGYVWVQDYPKPWEPNVGWFVFDAEFRWLGTVVLPTRLEVYAIGADYVLGKWTDDVDVEHVGAYTLRKP